jgi:prolyl-tRNA synthetase
MRQTQLFTKTLREAPADEVANNARLLIQAGYLQKVMAGAYAYLPLGLRVLKKIESIIREEMNAIGGQELLMTTLQDPILWKKTNRWDDEIVDNWFKSHLKNGSEVGIANTHEEPIVEMLKQYVNSYRDLPFSVYQFQTKFRNELRAKSGIMRVREFIMKDLYSFSRTEKEFKDFYEQCAEAYLKIFERVGIGAQTYRTVAAGGSFTTGLTDEFQTVTDAGEDTIYIDENKRLAINEEVYNDEVVQKVGLDKNNLKQVKAVEVGNIFPLGTKYTESLGLSVSDENGNKQPIIMGSYGIGLGRLLGAIVEVHHDSKGIIWPDNVAPYKYHLISLGESEQVKKFADDLYVELEKSGAEVLYDDRLQSAGVKLSDADLLGLPVRIVVSEKSIKQGGFEVKRRREDNATICKNLIEVEKI